MENSFEELANSIDNYLQTLKAIQSFISVITFDSKSNGKKDNCFDSIGRRMVTSEKNRISKSTIVTPDIVILDDRGYGYIVETKKSIAKETNFWEEIWQQLIKYDDDLIGWWTENEFLDSSCVILLLHYSRSMAFIKFIEQFLTNHQDLKPERDISIVEFSQVEERSVFMALRKVWGKIGNQFVEEKFENSVLVPLDALFSNEKFRFKFYDSEPPLEYTMSVVWALVNEKKSDEQFNEQDNRYEVVVNSNEITRDIQRLYGCLGGGRDVEFPKITWVILALNEFINIGLGEKLSNNGDFLIYYKDLRSPDLIESFFKRRKRNQVKKETGQLPLFNS